MTPAAQVHVAIGILSSFAKSGKSVADMLRDWGRKNRYAGSKDRAAISGVVFETLRRYKSSAYLLQSDRPRSRVLGALWQYHEGDLEKCAALFDGSTYGPDRLNEKEAHTFSQTDISSAPLDIRADFPKWLSEDLRATFGPHIAEEMQAFTARAPLDIRLNNKLMDRDQLISTWADLQPGPMPYAPLGVRFTETNIFKRLPNLEAREEFTAGLFDIQDQASQICALITSKCIGEDGHLLDYCAGAGGKSLGILAHRPDVQITATDIDAKRLAPLKVRAERAGITSIKITPMEECAGQVECVLVDAPCSGSGTWRRKPESKWRLSHEALSQRHQQQEEVLESAASHVRQGGFLIYATCSILASENTLQVEKFLQKNSDFTPHDWCIVMQDEEPIPCAFAEKSPYLQLSPKTTGTDGFFIGILKRSE